jgi:glycine cleavage system H protein
VAERKYTRTHEWITVDGEEATVGITDYAQSQLGDVVFLELPAAGTAVAKGASFGVIESVKAASDLYAPAGGEIVAVNERLAGNPELVNSDPYGEGWLIRVRLSGPLPDDLLDEAGYADVAQTGH